MTPKTSFEGKGTEAFADLIVLTTKCGAKLCLAAAPLRVIALRLQFSVFTVSFPPGEEFVSLRSHVGVICAARVFITVPYKFHAYDCEHVSLTASGCSLVCRSCD